MENKMNKALCVLVSALILTTGCAAQKQWGSSGGSKADGTVKLSYQVDLFEIATVSDQQGLEMAEKRCTLWGYRGAEGFDFENKQCVNSDCTSYTVTKEYQCLN
jgi:hypothetical protein